MLMTYHEGAKERGRPSSGERGRPQEARFAGREGCEPKLMVRGTYECSIAEQADEVFHASRSFPNLHDLVTLRDAAP